MNRTRTLRRLCAAVLAAALVCVGAAPALAHPLRQERRVLSNGVVLLVSEQRNVPMVVLRLLIDAGSRRDPAGKEGLANLTADLLTEGTRGRSATQIHDAVDSIGASLDSSAGIDAAQLALTVLSKDLGTGLDLLGDVLLHPSFPEAEVSRRREAVLASIKASEDDPGSVASRVFTEFLFRDEPYGHLAHGTPDGVKRVRRKDIVAFYAANYLPEHTIITVVGDVSVADVSVLLEKALKPWKAGAGGAFVYPTRPEPRPEVIKVQRQVTQANVILGHRGIARDNPDYYAINVMNFILGGGGFGSRLLDDIRTKEGLAYSVASAFSAPKSPGSFRIVLQTKNESTGKAVELACAELERIRREPVSEDDISNAKLYLTGSFPLQLDSNGEIASFLTEVEFFGLGADYADTYPARINAVTKEDILRVARQYLRPEQLSLIVVGDFAQAQIRETPPCLPTAPAPGS